MMEWPGGSDFIIFHYISLNSNGFHLFSFVFINWMSMDFHDVFHASSLCVSGLGTFGSAFFSSSTTPASSQELPRPCFAAAKACRKAHWETRSCGRCLLVKRDRHEVIRGWLSANGPTAPAWRFAVRRGTSVDVFSPIFFMF